MGLQTDFANQRAFLIFRKSSLSSGEARFCDGFTARGAHGKAPGLGSKPGNQAVSISGSGFTFPLVPDSVSRRCPCGHGFTACPSGRHGGLVATLRAVVGINPARWPVAACGSLWQPLAASGGPSPTFPRDGRPHAVARPSRWRAEISRLRRIMRRAWDRNAAIAASRSSGVASRVTLCPTLALPLLQGGHAE